MKTKIQSTNPTLQLLLKTVNEMRAQMQAKFVEIDKRFEQLATKKDISDSVEYLDKKIDAVALRIVNLEGKVAKVEETMMTQADKREILDTVDAFAMRVDTYDKKAVLHDYRLNQNEEYLRNHETRLRQLESRQQPM